MNMLDFMPGRRQQATGEVLAAWMVSPNIKRIRLGGSEVERFIQADQIQAPAAWVKIQLETGDRRAYTIRCFDPWAGTLDLEFVIHQCGAASGPASRWTQGAKAGDRLAFSGPRQGGFKMPKEAAWLVMAGDATALPAIQSIAHHLSEKVCADVFIELPEAADQQVLISAARLQVHWIAQGAVPGEALCAALGSHPMRNGQGYVWMAGEASAARAIRHLYLQERGLAPHRLSAKGYWKLGQSGHKDRGG